MIDTRNLIASVNEKGDLTDTRAKGERNIDDPVHHPAHYTRGKFEVIDFILDKQLNFPLGNAIKYIVRAGYKSDAALGVKEKTIQDLEKAKQYIDFQIEHLRGQR